MVRVGDKKNPMVTGASCSSLLFVFRVNNLDLDLNQSININRKVALFAPKMNDMSPVCKPPTAFLMLRSSIQQ
jgi:hypothetical protein